MARRERRQSEKHITQEEHRFQSFLEELSWLMASYAGTDFRAMARYLNRRLRTVSDARESVGGYVSKNPNKHFLVGVLPRLFMDEGLFPTNEDIAQFAKGVMKVELLRYHKKSRFELIGIIVCETDKLNDSELDELVSALDVLVTKGDKAKKLVMQRKKELYGWNAIIQELAKENVGDQDSQRRLHSTERLL